MIDSLRRGGVWTSAVGTLLAMGITAYHPPAIGTVQEKSNEISGTSTILFGTVVAHAGIVREADRVRNAKPIGARVGRVVEV